jgi:TfoX/Sxy family transcriptional regulator of competence genes
MAVDEELRAEVGAHLSTMDGIEEKPIVGGVGFTWRGNLLCGVMADDLLVRIAKHDYDEFVGDDGAKPMVMAGRSSKGWLVVHKSIVSSQPAMKKWLDRAIEYVRTLPAK